MYDKTRALLGDHEAAKRLTEAGVLLACPFCKGHVRRVEVPCGYETAKRWQRSFLMLVAQKRGLLD